MSNFTQFVANNASTTPAIAEETYDKFWLSNLRVNASDPTADAILTATFKAAKDVDGEKVLMPDATTYQVQVDGIFAYAANNASFAQAMDNVFSELKTIGVNQGIFV